MIGLKRHTVQISNSCEEWNSIANDICKSVIETCSAYITDVQHVGSTAVPGLPAKPIIDIAVGVESFAVIPQITNALSELGMLYRGDSGRAGGHLYIRESCKDMRTSHIHVVLHNGLQWNNYLKFRDTLISSEELKSEYAKLKIELQKAYPNDRIKYTESKAKFIRSICSD